MLPAFPPTLPTNTVIGRLAKGPGPSEAIPIANILSGYSQFNSVAQAAATSIPGTIQGVQTLGYYVAGDGGAALYFRAGSSTPGGFQSADGQWWQISIASFASVKQFGAFGDNSHDDTTAIQNAITAVGNVGGGTVFLPTGIYLFSATLNISVSGINIVGASSQSILNYTGSTVGIAITSGTPITNVTLRDLQISSSSATNVLLQTARAVNGINFERIYFQGGGTQVQLTSVSSVAGGSFSVCIYQCTFNAPAVVGLTLHPVGFGLVQAIFVYGCAFFGYAQQALFQSSGTGVFIFANRFERHLGTSITTPTVHIDTSTKVQILNNYFEDEGNCTAIELGSALSTIEISGNVFQLLSSGPSSGTYSNASAVNAIGNVLGLALRSNHVSTGGTGSATAGALFNLAASTIFARNNGFDSGTATWGFAMSTSPANIDIDGSHLSPTPTTFSSGMQQTAGMLARTQASYTNGAGAQAGTLTNAPAAGNPTKWIAINDNGTTRFIPAW